MGDGRQAGKCYTFAFFLQNSLWDSEKISSSGIFLIRKRSRKDAWCALGYSSSLLPFLLFLMSRLGLSPILTFRLGTKTLSD